MDLWGDSHETDVVIVVHLRGRSQERVPQAQEGPNSPHPGAAHEVVRGIETEMQIPVGLG